jgi:hypothetical protein
MLTVHIAVISVPREVGSRRASRAKYRRSYLVGWIRQSLWAMDGVCLRPQHPLQLGVSFGSHPCCNYHHASNTHPPECNPLGQLSGPVHLGFMRPLGQCKHLRCSHACRVNTPQHCSRAIYVSEHYPSRPSGCREDSTRSECCKLRKLSNQVSFQGLISHFWRPLTDPSRI